MHLALFSHQGGYYYSNKNSNQRDYFTSPLSHPVFGALISLQLKEVWEIMERPKKFPIIELGSGSGVLSRDIVRFVSETEPAFFDSMRYCAVDYKPSSNPFSGIEFLKSDSHPFKEIRGCIISNELVDSFPVHRFLCDGSGFKEIYVTLDGDDFIELIGEISTPRIYQRLSEYQILEGLHGEVNLAMENWCDSLADILKQGLILTVDYGDKAELLYTVGRKHGTLNCYYNHTVTGNPYLSIGDQDITAHVDFSALIAIGENSGLHTAGFTTQRQFLRNLGFQQFLNILSRSNIGQSVMDVNRFGMMELVKAPGMGGFKVLGQTKGLEGKTLSGFSDFPSDNSLMPKEFDAVLLSGDHMDLIGGSYPHLNSQIGEYIWPFNQENE
jgi:SAM-dependent MidA family methyltransferase